MWVVACPMRRECRVSAVCALRTRLDLSSLNCTLPQPNVHRQQLRVSLARMCSLAKEQRAGLRQVCTAPMRSYGIHVSRSFGQLLGSFQ